jgi:hypothetical protein
MLEKMRPYQTPFAVSGVTFLGMEFTRCWIRLTVPTAGCDTCVELSLTFSGRTSACWYVITITQPRTQSYQSSCLAYSHGNTCFFFRLFTRVTRWISWHGLSAEPSMKNWCQPRFDEQFIDLQLSKKTSCCKFWHRCGKPTICRSFS